MPSTSSPIAAAVARLASSNLAAGERMDVEQSMMIASTRSVSAPAVTPWGTVTLTIASTFPDPSAM